MNRFKSLLIGLALLLGVPAFGQTIATWTTLSAALDTIPGSTTNFSPAVNAGASKIIRLASCTGINAPSTTDNTKDTTLIVDLEWMRVLSIASTSPCVVNVQRGASGTKAASHANSANVAVYPTNVTIYFRTLPQGACTRSNEPALPRIEPATGIISDCLAGQWHNGDAFQNNRTTYASWQNPPVGAVLYTSVNSTGTTLAATTMYCTEIDLPYSKLATGLGVLNGTTVGTDNHLVALYDSAGNLLANSAVAGVLAASASEYQQISFTAKYYMVGPAQYFGCLQTNGTTATVRMLITQVQDTYLTKGFTGQTFGTIPTSVTVPTTFTTAVGPYYTVF